MSKWFAITILDSNAASTPSSKYKYHMLTRKCGKKYNISPRTRNESDKFLLSNVHLSMITGSEGVSFLFPQDFFSQQRLRRLKQSRFSC